MRIKNILGLVGLSVLSLQGCDPMHDIDKALDAKEEADRDGGNSNIQKSLNYTLAAADYAAISKAALANAKTPEDSTLAKSVASKLALNQFVKSSEYLPAIMKSKYPGLGKGSSVMVTLNYVTVLPKLVDNLNGIANFKLTKEDYQNPLVDWFTPERTPGKNIPAILASRIESPVDQEFRLVFYKYSEQEPDIESAVSPFFTEDFNEGYADKDVIGLRDWSQYNIKGQYTWQARPATDGFGAQFSSFKSGEENESWMISPQINLDGIPDAKLSFDVKYSYASKGHQPLTVMVSDNYTAGNPLLDATWTDITSLFSYPNEPNTTMHPAGDASLAGFAGKKIYVAFIYKGTSVGETPQTTTVLLDNVCLNRVQLTAKPNAEVIPQNAVYQFSGGKWNLFTAGKLDAEATGNTAVYTMQVSDYNEMGESGPGKNDNFSSSLLPANYLPQMLAQKYPYAQVGDQKIVVYQFYNKTVSNEADLYTLDSMRIWKPLSALTTVKEQFLNIGKEWVFDPTLKITMVSADYQAIVNWVLENKGEKWLEQKYLEKKNSEMWCGASAYYSNMNFTMGLRRSADADPDGTLTGLSDESAIALFHERIKEDGIPAVLLARYPDAPAMTSGVTQCYEVSYLVYPEKAYYMIKYEGLGNGQFKYLEGPVKQ
ncbi:MAG: choice-of-anchor J domain-containing protein [Bacteroidales bacterium]